MEDILKAELHISLIRSANGEDRLSIIRDGEIDDFSMIAHILRDSLKMEERVILAEEVLCLMQAIIEYARKEE